MLRNDYRLMKPSRLSVVAGAWRFLVPVRERQRLHKRGKKRLGEHGEAAIASDREEGAGIARADYRAIISDGGGCDD